MLQLHRTVGPTRRALLCATSGLCVTLAALMLPSAAWAQAEGEPVRGGVLKIATLGLDTSDPHRHTGSIGVQQVYVEGLTSIANDGTAQPFLAESFEVSEDGLVYTFRLREGVKFHNGDSMTASDVQANFERVKENIEGGWLASAMQFSESFEAPDERTFVVRMSQPYAPFLNLISELWILSPESPGWGETITQPLGTGPFLFGEWIANVSLTAPAFEDYWQQELPYLEAVEFDLRDVSNNALALRAGDLHIGRITVESIDKVEEAPDLRVEYLKGTNTDYVTFNNRNSEPPLDNVRVREAIIYALDKAAITQFMHGEAGIATNQWAPPGNAYFSEEMHDADKHASPDLKKARQILEEEGVTPAEHTIEVISWDQAWNQVAVEMIRELGFQVDYKSYDDLGLQQRLDQYDWDIALAGSGPRADIFLHYIVMTSDGPNVRFTGGIQDAEFDRDVESAVANPDFEERKDLYLDAWQSAMNNYYTVLMNHAAAPYGVREEVKGFQFGYTYGPHYAGGGLAETWLASEE